MLPDEVRKAVDVVESHADDLMHCIGVLHAFKEMRPVGVEFSKAVDELKASTQTIRAHLLAREAEVERLTELASRDDTAFQAMRDAANGWMAKAKDAQARAERAEALLREVIKNYVNDDALHVSLQDRITAHLSENSRG